MIDFVQATVQKYNMLSNNDTVIVALSGGADSVSLLSVLNFLKEKYNLNLFAFHLNHNIRGDEAKRDEDFCKNLCKSYDIKIFIENENIIELAKKQKISEELCGRNERYKFLQQLSQKYGAKVATAHTASDNAETMLFNISRGSSVAGLCGIVPVRKYIIRPLIEVTRQQVEQYCLQNNLKYVTDSTNLCDEYTRNRIRHNVVPKLKELNPSFEQSVSRLSESLRNVKSYLNYEATKVIKDCKTQFGYDCKKLCDVHMGLLDTVINEICKIEGVKCVEFKHIVLIKNILTTGGCVDLYNGYRAVVKQNVLRINNIENDNLENEILFDKKINFCVNKKRYCVFEVGNTQGHLKENLLSIENDYSKAVFRNRKQGDKFTYYKRNITKPLRKVLNENKIPSEIRDKIIVLAIDNNIIWCENIGVSKFGHINGGNKALCIAVNNEKGV